jgi:adenylylsulfate kinase
MADTVPLLIISGSMGAGKTTVLGEAIDLLTESGIAHAAFDLDWLTFMHPRREPFGQGLMLKNLAAIWPIYAAAGPDRLIVARIVDSREGLKGYREATPGTQITVCRLTASVDTMQRRLGPREPGMFREEALASILEASNAEDFRVDNDEGRNITKVARKVLSRAGWLNPSP